MDAELDNDVRVIRDQMNLALTNEEVRAFTVALLRALPKRCMYEAPTRIAMADRGELALELRLGRLGRVVLIEQIIEALINPPQPEARTQSGLIVEAARGGRS